MTLVWLAAILVGLIFAEEGVRRGYRALENRLLDRLERRLIERRGG